jgi:hypothetical protein
MVDEAPVGGVGEERFRKFLKIFQDFSQAGESLVALSKKQLDTSDSLSKKQTEIVNRQIDAVNRQIAACEELFEAITKDRDGAIAAVDDLIVEIQGLRGDLRALARANGLGNVLGNLLGGGGKRGR